MQQSHEQRNVPNKMQFGAVDDQIGLNIFLRCCQLRQERVKCKKVISYLKREEKKKS